MKHLKTTFLYDLFLYGAKWLGFLDLLLRIFKIALLCLGDGKAVIKRQEWKSCYTFRNSLPQPGVWKSVLLIQMILVKTLGKALIVMCAYYTERKPMPRDQNPKMFYACPWL